MDVEIPPHIRCYARLMAWQAPFSNSVDLEVPGEDSVLLMHPRSPPEKLVALQSF